MAESVPELVTHGLRLRGWSASDTIRLVSVPLAITGVFSSVRLR